MRLHRQRQLRGIRRDRQAARRVRVRTYGELVARAPNEVKLTFVYCFSNALV